MPFYKQQFWYYVIFNGQEQIVYKPHISGPLKYKHILCIMFNVQLYRVIITAIFAKMSGKKLQQRPQQKHYMAIIVYGKMFLYFACIVRNSPTNLEFKIEHWATIKILWDIGLLIHLSTFGIWHNLCKCTCFAFVAWKQLYINKGQYINHPIRVKSKWRLTNESRHMIVYDHRSRKW